MNRQTQKAIEALRWQPATGQTWQGRAVASGLPMAPGLRVKRIAYASMKGREQAIWTHEHDRHALPILASREGHGVFAPIYPAGAPWLLLGRLVDLIVETDEGDARLILPPLILCTTEECLAHGGPLIFAAEGGTSYALTPVYNTRRKRMTPYVTAKGIEG